MKGDLVAKGDIITSPFSRHTISPLSRPSVYSFVYTHVFSFKGVFAGLSCFCRRHQPDQAGDQLTVDPEAGLKTLETCAL